MSLYSADGRWVRSLDTRQNEFDISDLNSGVYILTLALERQRFSYRLLKE